MIKILGNQKQRIILISFLLGWVSFSVMAKDKPNLYVVKTAPVSQILYYSGALTPIGNQPVISPTEGVVVKKYFNYGVSVNKGAKLLDIQPTKLIQKVRDAESSYLTSVAAFNKLKTWASSSEMFSAEQNVFKAKRTLNHDKKEYELNKHLYKFGILPNDTVVESDNAYEDSKVSLQQAQRSLKQTIAKGKGDNYIIAKLKLATAKENYFSLRKQLKHTCVTAPTSGIILQPNKDNTSGDGGGNNKDNSGGPIDLGSTVNYQQVLVMVGNLSGVKVQFSVPEVNINQIHKGLKATITGSGFKGISLHGVVTEVSAQASSGQGGSIATFPANVSVDKVPLKDAKFIRSGMNAQVAITVYNAPKALTVPIVSVFKKAGNSYVKRYNQTSQTSTDVEIKTGKVLVHNVQVLSGLHAGDLIVIPAKK